MTYGELQSATEVTTFPLNRLLEPLIQSLGPDAVQHILAFHIDSTLQTRIDDLADRCNEGLLTAPEKAEYEGYVAEISLINMLKAKARRLLSRERSDVI
jgi:hypothetical protein